jgi:hypothetical protein
MWEVGEVRPETVGKSSDVGRVAKHHRGVGAAVDACPDLEPARRNVRPVELPPVDGRLSAGLPRNSTILPGYVRTPRT